MIQQKLPFGKVIDSIELDPRAFVSKVFTSFSSASNGILPIKSPRGLEIGRLSSGSNLRGSEILQGISRPSSSKPSNFEIADSTLELSLRSMNPNPFDTPETLSTGIRRVNLENAKYLTTMHRCNRSNVK